MYVQRPAEYISAHYPVEGQDASGPATVEHCRSGTGAVKEGPRNAKTALAERVRLLMLGLLIPTAHLGARRKLLVVHRVSKSGSFFVEP
jgi:hypothetical protein